MEYATVGEASPMMYLLHHHYLLLTMLPVRYHLSGRCLRGPWLTMFWVVTVQ